MNKRKPTQIPDSLKTVDVKALLRKRGIFMQQRINQEMKAIARPVAEAILNKKKTVTKADVQTYAHFTNDQVREYCEKQIHMVEIVEEKFNKKVEQFITKVVDGFLHHLDEEVGKRKSAKFKAKDYFDDAEDELMASAQLDFTPLLENVATIAGQRAADLIGSKDIYLVTDYRKKIAENVAKFTQSMLDTDRETLIRHITNGIEQGQSIGDIRNAITADFETISKSQANRITATEVSRASIQGQLDEYQQSGLVEGLQWVTFGASDECADYEGEIVSLDAGFYSSDNEFQDGNPPLHPNCKCQVIPILIEGEKVYTPSPNKELAQRVKELEAQIDKRTKEYREIKSLKADDEVYIKSLEKHLGIDDE